jgi:hypothetical protein
MDARTITRLSRCVAVIAALAAASPVAAAVRYVSPGGADTNTGLSAAAAWRTVAKANASAVAGDVILLGNGTYADFPNPAASGSALSRITYVGNLTDPSTVVITPGGTFTRNYFTLKGATLAGGFTVSATRDSITDCIVLGDRSNINAANDCMLARLTVNCQRFWFYGQEIDSVIKATRDTVQDCVFNLTATNTDGHVIRMRSLEACVFDRNSWNITSQQGAVGASATKLFWVRNSKFRDCHWAVVNNCTGACDEAGWIMQRDYTQGNFWARDTIDMGGPGDVQFFGSGSGSFPQSVMDNRYDRLLVRLSGNSPYGGAMVYQDGARWDTLTNCTIVGRGSGLLMNGVIEGPTLVDHCTIVGFSPTVGTMGFDLAVSDVWAGKSAFRSNIFYTQGNAPRVRNSVALYIPPNAVQGHLVSNNNLFWTPMVRDSAIYMAGAGTSAPGVGKPYCSTLNADSASVFGSPRFRDSTSVQTFDAHLGPGSWAAGAGWGGSDAGAFPLSGSDADLTGPVAVGSLLAVNVTGTSASLQWAAPADLPNLGSAAQYDLRQSTSPLNDGNFASATAVGGLPAPRAPGAFQSVVVSGLTPGSTYYFGLRSRDVSGNWSTISNVVNIVASSDVIPPAPINDLRPN